MGGRRRLVVLPQRLLDTINRSDLRQWETTVQMGSDSRKRSSRASKKNSSETRRLLLLVLCVSCLFLSGLFIGYTHFVNHPSKPHDKDSFSKLTSSEKVDAVKKASGDIERSLEVAALQSQVKVAHSSSSLSARGPTCAKRKRHQEVSGRCESEGEHDPENEE